MKIIYTVIVSMILMISISGCKSTTNECDNCVVKETFITNTQTNSMTGISLNKKVYVWEGFTPTTNRYDGVVK